MNNNVLRGFCQKCGQSTNFKDWEYNKKQHLGLYLNQNTSNQPSQRFQLCDGEIEWFLSPKQMRILEVRKEIWDYEGFADMLERNPFLVSKILKDAEEKSKGENK